MADPQMAPVSAPAPSTPAPAPAADEASPDAGAVRLTLTAEEVAQLRQAFNFIHLLLARVDPEGEDETEAEGEIAEGEAPQANALSGLGDEINQMRG